MFRRSGWVQCTIPGCGVVLRGEQVGRNIFPWLHVCPMSGCGGNVVSISQEQAMELIANDHELQEIAYDEHIADFYKHAEANAKNQEREAEVEFEADLIRADFEFSYFVREYDEAHLKAELLEIARAEPSPVLRRDLLELLSANLGLDAKKRPITEAIVAICRQFDENWPRAAVRFVYAGRAGLYPHDDIRAAIRDAGSWEVVQCDCGRVDCPRLIVRRKRCAINTSRRRNLSDLSIELDRELEHSKAGLYAKSASRPSAFVISAFRLIETFQAYGYCCHFKLRDVAENELAGAEARAVELSWGGSRSGQFRFGLYGNLVAIRYNGQPLAADLDSYTEALEFFYELLHANAFLFPRINVVKVDEAQRERSGFERRLDEG